MRTIAAAVLLVVLGGIAEARRLEKDDVPEPLRPWADWVLHDQEEARCPFLQNQGDARRCTWPARLVLALGEAGGTFSQDWLAFRKTWVPLPGDEQHWPQDVTVDGKPATATLRNGVPMVELPEGEHAVAGGFACGG